MKKMTFFLSLMLLFALNLNAQNQDREFLIKEYLKQSEKQKKTGIAMLVVGSGMAGLGIIIANSGESTSSTTRIGYSLGLIGIPVAIIGIPILISSASKARKAAQLSVGTQMAHMPLPLEMQKTYPVLTLSVQLNCYK
jgi:hypothetical protein